MSSSQEEQTNGGSTNKQAASSFGRSVVDFVTEQELLQALQGKATQGKATQDWMLPVPDPEAEEQTLEGEMKRLLTLKSYMLLDAKNEQVFDQLTQEACDIFGVPTSLISLIDLGRQFLFSNTGGGDVKETTRESAFCSHTILNKNGILVVKDTQEDDRFKENVLVKEAPHLRFYAGAPLISPEGDKLGTFCIEGPEPRPEGLTGKEQAKLQEYAQKTMQLMVERRKNLRDKLANNNLSDELRLHAAVTTNLGDLVYMAGDLVTAMHLFQESVQTLMCDEGQEGAVKPPAERQDAMAQFLALMSVQNVPDASRQDLLKRIAALYTTSTTTDSSSSKEKKHIETGLPCLFHLHSKLKGTATPRPLPVLNFSETFQIDLSSADCKKSALAHLSSDRFPLEERPFTAPLTECSKATLFNMGLIQYQWGSPDMALQFFHLSASVSHKFQPLLYDPVDMGCINNMAQIHLQYNRPEDAMKLLTQALTRGNETLAALYTQTHVDDIGVGEDEDDEEGQGSGSGEAKAAMAPEDAEDLAVRRTRRLRRKLARTLLNMGDVHFYNCNYQASMTSCRSALALQDPGMRGLEKTASWYNMSLNLYYMDEKEQALEYLNQFLEKATELNGPDHLQNADGFYRKGLILFELGKLEEAMDPLRESLRIVKLKLGAEHGMVAETLRLMGKVQLGQEDYDAALSTLNECLSIQRSQSNREEKELTFDSAQTMLDLGRAYQARGDLKASLKAYLEAVEWSRKFFGPEHVFVARIASIIANLYTELGQKEESAKYSEEVKRIEASAAANAVQPTS